MTNQTPKISVIIPSFNKVKFIQETLDSVISQNYTNLEIIIQDGGSTDGSLEVVKQFAIKYPKLISWVSGKDKGQTEAVNRGFNKATGDILTFLNTDDVYEPGALKAVSEVYLTHTSALWFAGRGKVINETGNEITKVATLYKNLLLYITSYNLLLITNYLIQPSVFITRKCWEKYKPFIGTDRFIMEYDMWLKIGKSEMPVIVNNTLSSFRLPTQSFSRNSFNKTLNEDDKIIRKHTINKIILFLHYLHNFIRKIIIKLY